MDREVKNKLNVSAINALCCYQRRQRCNINRKPGDGEHEYDC